MTIGPARSPIGRLLQLGSLVGRVGASVAVEQLVSLVFSGPSRQMHRIGNLVLNAERIVSAVPSPTRHPPAKPNSVMMTMK